MTRFGLPTMPAELSLYSLNFIDRLLLVRLAGPRRRRALRALGQVRAGGQRPRQGLPARLAAARLLDRGRRRGPPRLRGDRHLVRRRLHLLRRRACGCSSRWIVRTLAAPEFFESYEAIGLVSTGVMLYALYLVLVVVLGRTGRTEFNFPATAVGTVANIGLNLFLIPELGIVGAGISLVASYAVVLALMYVFTQRLFPVPYEWGRLAPGRSCWRAVLVAAGELLLPTEGFVGLASRTALWLLYPAGPVGDRASCDDEERRAIAANLSPVGDPRGDAPLPRGLRRGQGDPGGPARRAARRGRPRALLRRRLAPADASRARPPTGVVGLRRLADALAAGRAAAPGGRAQVAARRAAGAPPRRAARGPGRGRRAAAAAGRPAAAPWCLRR